MPRLDFTLSIVTDNSAMRDRFDVAAALEDVAAQLRAINATQTIDGPVRNGNGTTVGTFTLHLKEGR